MPKSEEFQIPGDEEIAAPPADPSPRPAAPSWQQLLDEVTISLDELHRRQRAALPLLGDFPEDPRLPQLVPAIRAPLDQIRNILSQFTVQVRGGLRSVTEVTTAIEELDNAISSLTGYQRNLQNWASLASLKLERARQQAKKRDPNWRRLRKKKKTEAQGGKWKDNKAGGSMSMAVAMPSTGSPWQGRKGGGSQ
eukprot:jgi/Mesvir1/18820/Mv10534-RA.1